jgi:hypothetical protein
MAFQADIAYLRTREDLLRYEDARFNALMSAVANFYISRNDDNLWGHVQRAVAIELARLEYMTAYDIVAKNPEYLTPPDIKRRFATPLFISSGYPGSTQYDLDYKQMIVNLIPAYQQGSTAIAIAEIIEAYTGKMITVVELYKKVGDGYNMTDHNGIVVSINYGSGNPSDLEINIVNINQIQQITSNLYTAIDLNKPAHIGLNFTTIQTESLSMESILNSITDFLRIYVCNTDTGTWETTFTQSPFYDQTLPETQLTALGKNVGQSFPIDFGMILSSLQFAALPAAFKVEYSTSFGTGNGTNTFYQFAAPVVSGTVVIYAGGVQLTEGTDYTFSTYSSTMAYGSITSGIFTANEEVIQASTGAHANIIGQVGGVMIFGAITGSPDASHIWVGQASGAHFTPTTAPAPVTTIATVTFTVPPATGAVLTWTDSTQTSYTLNPDCYSDVALVDDTGAYLPPGVITKARGLLAPRIDTAWEMGTDTLTILNLG